MLRKARFENGHEARGSLNEGLSDPILFEKGGEFFYFLTDALGTVRTVVDSTGAVKASYEFDPDGNKISPPNTLGVESAKTWIGGHSVNDDTADAGLYLMGHRFYDPSIGRFLNRDPIGFAGGMNLYQYSRSSPLTFIDPMGLQTGTAVDVVKMASDIVRSYASRVTAAEAAAAASAAGSDGPLPIGDAVAILILLRAMSGGHEQRDPEALNNAFLGKNNVLQLNPADPCKGKLPVGQDLELIFRTSKGPLGFLATIGTDGTNIILSDINIYPYGWERQPGQNLTTEILAYRGVLRDWGLQFDGGYKNIVLEGIRLGETTANPGHIVRNISIPMRR